MNTSGTNQKTNAAKNGMCINNEMDTSERKNYSPADFSKRWWQNVRMCQYEKKTQKVSRERIMELFYNWHTKTNLQRH